MQEFNVFDYIAIFALLLSFAFYLGRYVLYNKDLLLNSSIVKATITKIIQETTLFRAKEFSFMIDYHFKGNRYQSILKGYVNPFSYSIGQSIDVLVSNCSPSKVNSVRQKGRIVRVFRNIILLSLIFGAILLAIDKVTSLDLSNNLDTVILAELVLLSLLMFSEQVFLFFLFKRKSIKSHGVIKSFEKAEDMDKTRIHIPIVEFEYKDKQIQFKSNVPYNDIRHLGKEVPIFYLAETPEIAEIDSLYSKWSGMAFWFIALILSIVFCILKYVNLVMIAR